MAVGWFSSLALLTGAVVCVCVCFSRVIFLVPFLFFSFFKSRDSSSSSRTLTLLSNLIAEVAF